MAPTDQERQTNLVVVSVAFTGVSSKEIVVVGKAQLLTISCTALTVLVRSIIRFCIIRCASNDDYAIIVALLFDLGYMTEILVGKANHIGFPHSVLTFDNMLSILKVALSIEVTYHVIIGFIKVSLLCMYLRFAVSERFRHLCYGTIIFQLVFMVVCIAVTLGQCRPIQKLWDPTQTIPGSCINSTVFFYTVNIITDFWIIILPVKTLKGINRPLKEKIALGFTFGAGTIAVLMSILRLQSIYTYSMAADPFREAIGINFWSVLEVNIAMLCACVPALKPIFSPRNLMELKHKSHHKYRGSTDDSSHGGHIRKSQSSGRASYATTGRPDLFKLPTISPSDQRTTTTPSGGSSKGDIFDDFGQGGATSTSSENDAESGLSKPKASHHE